MAEPLPGAQRRSAALMHLLGVVTLFVGPLIVYRRADSTFVRQSAENALYWYGFMTLIGAFVIVGWLYGWQSGIQSTRLVWKFILVIGWYGVILISGVASAYWALHGSQGIYVINRRQF